MRRYASTRDTQLRLASIIADLCLMKSDAPELYRAAREGKLTLKQLEGFLPYKQWFDESPQNRGNNLIWSADVWRHFLGQGELLGGETKEEFGSRFNRHSLRMPRNMLGMVCDWIDGFAFPESVDH